MKQYSTVNQNVTRVSKAVVIRVNVPVSKTQQTFVAHTYYNIFTSLLKTLLTNDSTQCLHVAS